MRLRISARKSDLARLQAYQVGNALIEKHPKLEISYSFRESLGDKNLTDPLWKMPEKGVFTEDFVQDLIEERTELVVHSWKDLPTSLRPGTKIVATLPRADQRDLLLFKKTSLASDGKIRLFSSSPRRAYNLETFLTTALPLKVESIEFVNVRGNIQTRVRKLMDDPNVDALVLAKAAMDRLLSAEEPEFNETRSFLRNCLQELNWMVLPLSVNPNAAAQGALAVEVKEGRPEVEELLTSIQCQQTFDCVTEERNVLSSFGGGCHQKIGVAVLPRKNASVFFLRGLTDAGEVLSKASYRQTEGAQAELQFHPHELFSSKELTATRTPLKNVLWPDSRAPADQDAGKQAVPVGNEGSAELALWAAKAEAIPADFAFKGLLWAAGLKTWQKLAARGYWVHGSAEGLGEDEEPRVEILVNASTSWTKLTHSDATSFLNGRFSQVVPTYEVKVDISNFDIKNKKIFFWHSGSQFLAALHAKPELKNKLHACGPGSTYKTLQEHLGPHAQIQIFLNEEEWRSLCSR